MAKFCIKATILLKLLSQSSANWVAFEVGVLGMGRAAGEGRICTSNGHLVAGAVAVGFNYVGIG